MSHNDFPFRMRVPAAVVLLAMALPAAAQNTGDRITELERKLEQSLKMIEQLSAEVRQLRESAKSPAPAAPTTAEAPRIEALERQVAQMSAAASRSTFDGLPLHGFADVGFVTGRKNDGGKGFGIGSLDFYLTPQLGDRVRTLTELIFEVDRDGSLNADLERMQLGYAFSDAATLWVGRYHTPVGYWNTAFHHGAQIQTSILRPRFIDFEDKGGIIPTHNVGLWLTGRSAAGSGKLTYDVFAGNGPRISGGELNPNAARDDNHNSLVGANIGWEAGGGLDGLKLGVHAMQAKVADDLVAANRTRLRTYGGYATYVNDDWEVLSEYYRFRNADLSGGTGSHRSWAGFVQVGRSTGNATPYVRFERTALDQADSYFAQLDSGRSYRRTALGLRYDLDPKATLKVEWLKSRTLDGTPDDQNELRMQYAIRF